MKKLLLATATLAAALMGPATPKAQAQDNPDQTSISIAGYEILLNAGNDNNDRRRHHNDGEFNWSSRRQGYKGRIGLIELGTNYFQTFADSYAAYPADEHGFMRLRGIESTNLAINLINYSTSLVRSGRLGVTLGLGFIYNDYVLDSPVTFGKVDGVLRPINLDSRPPKYMAFRSWWTHHTVMLEFTPTHEFVVSAGGYVDYQIWSDAFEARKKALYNPYMSHTQAGIAARIGFREYYLYGKYAFTDFFEKGRGPRLRAYTFGVGFGF